MLSELQVSKIQTKQGNGATVVQRATQLASTAIAQIEAAGAEGARAGRRFWLGNSAAITGIAPVQALPTTGAQWALWNLDPNRAVFLEELGMYLTAGTPGVGGILLACLFQAPAQVGATQAGTAVGSQSNGSSVSKVIAKPSVTITQPTAPTWYPLASNSSPNVTAFAGATFLEHRNIQGRIVIPPNQGLGLAVVAPAGTTPLFAPFASWMEYETDLE